MIYAAQGPRLAAQGYEPVTMIGDAPAYGVGDWLNPPGWAPRPLWLHRRMMDGSICGVIVEVPAPAYVRIGTGRQSRRIIPRDARTKRIPKLITPTSAAHERRLRADGCISASEMPGEVVDMIIECYGRDDLPPEVTDLCLARLREKKRAEHDEVAPAKIQGEKPRRSRRAKA